MPDAPPDLSPFGLELREVLGRGATGVVMRAVDREAGGRTVAVKLIDSTKHEVLESLRREVCSITRLRHPNIAPLLQARTSAEPRFLVYDLFRQTASGYPLSERATVDCGIKLCSGLAASHAKRIIHGDIKPANLLWHGDDQPMLSDFGSARIETSTRYHTGVAFSPEWAPPWIHKNGSLEADVASDVWSLAASLIALHQSETPETGPQPHPIETDLLAILRTAMPTRRPTGTAPDLALDLGRELQAYQQRRGWTVTPFPSETQLNHPSLAGGPGRPPRTEVVTMIADESDPVIGRPGQAVAA